MSRQAPPLSRLDHAGRADRRVERIEPWFHGSAYVTNRHKTYAIGRTLAGVQSFSYRRSVCNSLPGNTTVLHPDEAQDGQAGTDEGFPVLDDLRRTRAVSGRAGWPIVALSRRRRENRPASPRSDFDAAPACRLYTRTARAKRLMG
ncbi:AraC family ligand binding domain-containing protein [Paraburkholderia xenovorans]|uniref:AraC family ligand binding domain-containing protein n=1 Tax=Paraburkholderia xenovorans TaxID=36873 RepID=UPI0038B93306